MPKIAQYEITTPPAPGTAVTLDEVKEHLRVDFTAEDTIIQFYLDAAEELIQSYTNQLLKTQIQRGNFGYIDYSQFEGHAYITFKRFPVTSFGIVEIHNGTTFTTLTLDTDYLVEQREKQFPRILFKQIDNLTFENIAYPFRITATCGYANTAAVPDKLKLAIRMLVAKLYDNRGDCPEDGNGLLLPKELKMILGPSIIREVFG